MITDIFSRIFNSTNPKEFWGIIIPMLLAILIVVFLISVSVLGISGLYILIALVLIALMRLGYILYREDIERMELERKESEITHRLLSGQLNPHFIFNFMNTLQTLFLTKSKEEVLDSFTYFSNFMRKTLDKLSERNCSVSSEIEYCTEYVKLQNLRFSELIILDFEIDNNIDNDVLIPSFIIQPFLENSIEHGFNHKVNGDRKILLKIRKLESNFKKAIMRRNYKEFGLLEIIIEDNGIGITLNEEIKINNPLKKHESKGLKIIGERLDIFNKLYYTNVFKFTVSNIESESKTGTKISIICPFYSKQMHKTNDKKYNNR